MSTVYLNPSDPSVQAIVKASFPGYRGKDIRAEVSDSVQFTGTNWDDGRKDDYVIVQLSTLKTHAIQDAPYFRPSDLHSTDYTIPPGFVVVNHHRYGQRESLAIIGPAQNITPMLAPPADLTNDEKIVLAATRSLKSSYGTEKDYRFSEARRYTGITTRRWDDAKAALISRKLLNKAGAITVEGRNAIGRTELYTLRPAPSPTALSGPNVDL